MAILDTFNTPPEGKGGLSRFSKGTAPKANSTYTPYGVNDQTSLYDSKLHYEYSTIGQPGVNTSSDKYNSSTKQPSQGLDLTPGPKNDGGSGFNHRWLPNQEGTYEEIIKAEDLAARG